VLRRFIILTLCTLALGSASSALALASDATTTRAYVQANYALVQYAALRLSTAHALLEGVVNKVKANCPHAVAGSPQDPESTELSNEIIGAMVIAAIHPALPEITTYLHVAEHSRWSNSGLTRTIRSYAGKLKTLANLAPPNLCADTNAWKASGYHELPASTPRFDRVFEPAWVALGELPAALKAYERPEERSAINGSIRFESRITEFEAEAVETWGEIMNSLGVSP
jgi:hypothetical protein